jgi:hypothetical protein
MKSVLARLTASQTPDRKLQLPREYLISNEQMAKVDSSGGVLLLDHLTLEFPLAVGV